MQALSVSVVVKYIETTYILAETYVLEEQLNVLIKPPKAEISLQIRIQFKSDINPSGTASKQVLNIKCPMAFTEKQRANISLEEDQHNYNCIYSVALGIESIHNVYVKGNNNTLDHIIDGCESDLLIVDDNNNTIKNDIINSLKTIRDNDTQNGGDTVCFSLLCVVSKTVGPQPVQDLLLAGQALGMGCSKTGQADGDFNVVAFEEIIELSGMTRELFLHCFWYGTAMFDGSYLVSLLSQPFYIVWLLGSDPLMLDFFKLYIEDYFPDVHQDGKIKYTQKASEATETNPEPKIINVADIRDLDVAKIILQKWSDSGCSDKSYGVPMKNYHINRMLHSNGLYDLRQTLESDKEHHKKIEIINYYRTNDNDEQNMYLMVLLASVVSITTVAAACVTTVVVAAAASFADSN